MAQAPTTTERKVLGKIANEPTDALDRVEWKGGPITVTLNCSEFTSHCPVTGQPDFATLKIVYQPIKYIVETKSLKLFLWRYREKRAFNEALTAEIAEEFRKQIKPHFVEVTMEFFARGGISVTACATREAVTP